MKRSGMMNKLLLWAVTLVILFTNVVLPVNLNADSDIPHDNRLVQDESFINQEVYSYEGFAVSLFYNYPIKRYDALSRTVLDIRDDSIINEESDGCDFADISLVSSDNACLFFIDSDLIVQYLGLSVKSATLTLTDKTRKALDITSEVSKLLSVDSFSDGNSNVTIPVSFEMPHTEDYKLYFKIETHLPAKNTNSVSSGYYFVYPYGTNDTLAIDSNNSSDYKVFLWNFVGSNTQVWNIAVSALNGYATLKNVYNSMYLRWDLSNMNVILDSGGVVGNRFVIEESGSYVTMKPWIYTEKIVRYDTLSNYSNVYLTNTPSTLINAEKWTLIPVTPRGAAGSYRYTSSSGYRCYPYALRQTQNWFINGFSGTWTVNDVANFVKGDSRLATYGISCRILESGLSYVSYVKTNEYRIAVRIGIHPGYPVAYRYDYHFMEQLSDGSWAHKPGMLSSCNDISDPETDYWNVYNADGSVLYQGYYNSDIIYLAISIT